MVFNSFVFAVFLVAVYLLYLCTMRRFALQNALLLGASYFFYGWWDWRFLFLLAGTTVLDYLAALLIDRRKPPQAGLPVPDGQLAFSDRQRRMILAVSIAANLGVLGFFKYFDFFSESFCLLLQSLGISTPPRLLHVILPVGISFYTFQSMSYTIDVYRGKLPAARNPLDFALFVAFFPQLVAGPIVRAVDFLPQVQRPRRLDLEQIYAGCALMLWGLFKKVVIADNLAVIVDRTFSAQQTPWAGQVLVGVYAFAIQIYCDFSGYTDIARGCAKTMGFEFNLNFNLPYLASNPVEFWRRWHMSLSTWLRDYLYVPLGGNRRGPVRTQINLLLTMILGGLWHGAAWTFVLWGVYQGVLLCLHRVFSRSTKAAWPIPPWIKTLGFFHLVCLGWLIFRADSVAQVGRMLGSFCSFAGWSSRGLDTLFMQGLTTLAACTLPLAIVEILQFKKRDWLVWFDMPGWVRGLSYACLFYALILFGVPHDKPFIYFQF